MVQDFATGIKANAPTGPPASKELVMELEDSQQEAPELPARPFSLYCD
jgi:hypothetical protein